MRLRTFLCVGLPAAVVCGCQTVPYTGRRHLILVSVSEEQQLGLQAYEQTLSQARLSRDSEKTALVREVGQRLAKAADRPDFQWEFNLIDDPKTVNAFCLPGGKVAVYSGLLPVAKDETGLAVVLGHEIAHALARHGAERMSQGLLANFGGEALSVLLARQPEGAQQLYSQAYGLGVNLGVLLPYSRQQESEADHIGLLLMAKADYDPRRAVDFWERMKAQSKGGGGALEKYLSTHPPDEQRIRQVQDWLPEALGYYRPAR